MSIWLANDKFNGVLSSGYTVGQTTLSTSAVPDNVPTIVVLAKGTDNETVFSVTGKTINSLTGVTRLRGANVDLDAQTPITCLNNEEFVNQYSTALFSGEGLADFIYGVDGGSNDTYVISLTVAPTDYASLTGVPIVFTANTANTAGATLNINSLGAKDIKKNVDEALEDGDIKDGQLVIVSYDGVNFQLLGGVSSSDLMVKEAPAGDLIGSGSKTTFTAGENLVFGDVCYIKSDGKAWKSGADGIATAGAVFMALATISADASGAFLISGVVRMDAWTWSVGGILYLSSTAGAMTQTAPTGTNKVVQVLGVSTHADRILFNPVLGQVELA